MYNPRIFRRPMSGRSSRNVVQMEVARTHCGYPLQKPGIRDTISAMALPPSDTHPRASAVLMDRLAAMTPVEKLQRVRDLTTMVARLSLAGLRSRHPGEDEGALLLRLARIRLGDAIVDTVYADAQHSADTRGGT